MLADELERLLPRRELVLDAHTHLGKDEDGYRAEMIRMIDKARLIDRGSWVPGK